jgi:Flp pilus assembly pilin Flp
MCPRIAGIRGIPMPGVPRFTMGACMGEVVKRLWVRGLWQSDEGQDIAEYAVMLAVILVIVLGTVRLIGTNANTVFSRVASSIQ